MIRSVLVRIGIKDVGSNPTVITSQDSPNGMASPLQGEIMPVRFRYPAPRKHLHNVSSWRWKIPKKKAVQGK